MSMTTRVWTKASYDALHGEFAHTSATIVATTSMIPPPASTARNDWRGRPNARARGCSLSIQV